jgi:hypothetical protein
VRHAPPQGRPPGRPCTSRRPASRSVARCAPHSPAPRQVDGVGDGIRELDARNRYAHAGPGGPGEAKGPQLGRHLRHRRFYVGLRMAPAVREDDRTSGWSKGAHASTVIACHKRGSGRRRLSTPPTTCWRTHKTDLKPEAVKYGPRPPRTPCASGRRQGRPVLDRIATSAPVRRVYSSSPIACIPAQSDETQCPLPADPGLRWAVPPNATRGTPPRGSSGRPAARRSGSSLPRRPAARR